MSEITFVTLHAQPYDIEARGFYFKTLEEYKEKAAKNFNSYGGIVEEYEFQFIDGEGSQELLDHLSLEDFFEIVETWKTEKVEKIDLLAEAVGWHHIGNTPDDIEDKLDSMIVYSSSHNKDDLGMEVMAEYDSELYARLEGVSHLFDFERWLDEFMTGNSASVIYKDGKHYYIELPE